MSDISCTPPIHVELDPGSIIVLPDKFDVEVTCTSGVLWLAQLDSPEDLAMHAGESMAIVKGKHSIINAIAAARLKIYLTANRQRRLTWSFSRNCHELRHALARQVLVVKGRCSIRFAEDGAAIWV